MNWYARELPKLESYLKANSFCEEVFSIEKFSDNIIVQQQTNPRSKNNLQKLPAPTCMPDLSQAFIELEVNSLIRQFSVPSSPKRQRIEEEPSICIVPDVVYEPSYISYDE